MIIQTIIVNPAISPVHPVQVQAQMNAHPVKLVSFWNKLNVL